MERLVQTPFIEQVASSIKETGEFKRELIDSELAEIMQGVVKSLLTGQDKVKANVPQMDVKIENSQGVVQGKIQVSKPITATIGVGIKLVNSEKPGQIKLAGLGIKEDGKGLTAKLALKAINIKGKAQEALKNPNQALGKALYSQLLPKGVKLESVALSFLDNKLSTTLKGKSA